MNEKQRDVLHQHRSFFMKNLIWTEDLERQLVAQGLLTDSMLNDIQSADSRENKTAKLLDVIPLRRKDAFNTFCDVVQLSGHFFLADFLRDEETTTERLDSKELFKKLPFLEKNLRQVEIKQVESYIEERANDEYVKQVWRKNAKEKEKAIDAKQLQLQQAFEFAEEAKQKKEQLSDLEKQLLQTTEEITVLRSQLRAENKKWQEADEKRKGDIEIQMRYSNASESTLQRTAEKLKQTEDIMHQVRIKLGSTIKTFPRNSDHEEMKEIENEFSFVPEELDILLDKHRDLQNTEKKYDKLLEEQNYILSHLGFKPSEENPPSLIHAYKDFTVKNEENISTLRFQVEHYGQMLEEQKAVFDNISNNEQQEKKRFTAGTTVWQAAIMSVMRKQLQDIKHQNRMKDVKIEFLEKEIVKLKSHKASITREPPSERIHSEVPSIPNSYMSEDSERSHDAQSEAKTISTVRTLNTGMSLPPLKNMSGIPPNASPLYRKPGLSGTCHSKPNYNAPTNVPRSNLPEGLTTSPVRFENRRYGTRIGYVLGDLKSMHGKYRVDKSHQHAQTSPRV